MPINKTLGNIFKGDKVIWMVFFFLCIVSIMEVFSASSELTYKGGNYFSPIVKHVAILVVGVFFMVVVLNIPCRYFKHITVIALGVAFVTLLAVPFVGEVVNGSRRWLSILGIQFQPSEIGKGALVLATAQILSAMQTDKGADPKAFHYILTVCAFIIPLIFRENFSTAILLIAVIILMMFIGRVPLRQIGKLLGVLSLTALLFLALVMGLGDTPSEDTKVPEEKALSEQQAKNEGFNEKLFHRFGTWKGRILDFMNNKELPPQQFDLDEHAQVGHANIAIASSNFVGKGPGNSVERDFLPQAFSDFIYTIIIEEMGIEGAIGVAMLYIILLFRTGRIASHCENNFPAFLAMGLALLLVSQALFNMLVAVGLAPVTGQPLPLISKGGTSTIINCIYVGAILSISRTAKRKTVTDSSAGTDAPSVRQAATA